MLIQEASCMTDEYQSKNFLPNTNLTSNSCVKNLLSSQRPRSDSLFLSIPGKQYGFKSGALLGKKREGSLNVEERKCNRENSKGEESWIKEKKGENRVNDNDKGNSHNIDYNKSNSNSKDDLKAIPLSLDNQGDVKGSPSFENLETIERKKTAEETIRSHPDSEILTNSKYTTNKDAFLIGQVLNPSPSPNPNPIPAFVSAPAASVKKDKQTKYCLNLRPDCIRKRIKTYLNNYIINKLNMFLKNYDSSYYFFKLPKELVVDMKIEKNKALLNMTVKEIYSTTVPNEKEIPRIAHNTAMMEKIKTTAFVEFVAKTLKDIFAEYISSKEYKEDMEALRKKEGTDYIEVYSSHVQGFLSYFNV